MMQRNAWKLAVLGGLLITGCGISPRIAAVPEPETIQEVPKTMPVIPEPDPAAVTTPDGFHAEVVMKGLIYPTSVEFDDAQSMYIAESGYAYGDLNAPARVFRVLPDGNIEVAVHSLMGPVNDLLWYEDRLYISHRGKISALDRDGELRDLVTGLPSFGDHHNNQMTVGPDGKIYFGQGTATNSGVVGVDNFLLLWLPLYPDIHDRPAHDIALTGKRFLTMNPFVMAGGDILSGEKSAMAKTGAFSPFGKISGGVVQGVTKANGTILRMNPDGSDLEVYAWGLRNPFGVMWGLDKRLYASENGFDERGSRPVANDTDDLYVIKQGAWYGWPDFAGGVPVTDKRFKPEGRPQPEFLMKEHPPVEKPFMTFQPHSAVTKIGFDSNGHFGGAGYLFMALYGSEAPITGKQPHHADYMAHRIVRIHLQDKQIETFFANAIAGKTILHAGGGTLEVVGNPAGLQRPVDVVFSPDGKAMYVTDFGVMDILSTKVPLPKTFPGTGVIWRIVPEGVMIDTPPANLSIIPAKVSRDYNTE
ncbi:MAG: glucose dehydrogenase [wastewater metagenome]|nr:glucose dehydrogenase [Candidatus Loosdrechtia aerotolerans]